MLPFLFVSRLLTKCNFVHICDKYVTYMKKHLLLILGLLHVLTSYAQTNNTYKISYKFVVNEHTISSNEQNMDTSMLLAVVAAMSEENDGILAQVWTNHNFVKSTSGLLKDSYELMNKSNGISSVVYPSEQQYYSFSEQQDKILDLGDEIMLASEIPVEFLAQEKVIAGYTCKLAKINIEVEEESASIEIWYSSEIPKTYWGEYYFLKNIPGGALEISTNGIGISASEVTIENDTTIFDIPENYTQLQEPLMGSFSSDYAYSEDKLQEYEVGENRIAFLDEHTDLYGIKNNDGEIILEPEYTQILNYSNDLTIVTDQNYLSGVIDMNGQTIIPMQYETIYHNDVDNTFLVSMDGNYGLLSSNNQIIIPREYTHLTFLDHDYAIASRGELSGIIDSKNTIIVPFNYYSITEIVGDKFIAMDEDYKYSLYTINEDKIATYDLITDANEDNLFIVMHDSKYGFMDGQGKVVIPLEYEYASSFYQGTAAVLLDGQEDPVFINNKGKIIDKE